MPGLAAQRSDDQLVSNESSSYYPLSSKSKKGSVSSPNGFWPKHSDDVSYNQLQKFWSKLSLKARQDLLKIDKRTLLEQARKNMYCSRCYGLLLESATQIVMYGKSLQHQGAGGQLPHNRLGISKVQMHDVPGSALLGHDETQDPTVHPWGGLVTTRDGALTLLDSYLYSKSLKEFQHVFESAHSMEREHELRYPDACGRGRRVWTSQGTASYGRGHGTRETCALHTARPSCDTLLDFWSALEEETQQSLLRIKEEDFIERLMHRFDSKRFCKDCRRNVIHEFKELKELKRTRREPRCTSWFCAADTAFQYEVSNDTIRADWHKLLIDSAGTYDHFEWAVGSREWKSDILEFQNVGTNRSVQVNVDLGGLHACYITLRAWKLDGQCTEYSVKAHALNGRQCVHCMLAVGDGYVKVTCVESIRRFFEYAEEAEEEEFQDDDSVDKDGNDIDGLCSRPQKHAKSPELAREFLLEAAAVIFKEQVEKAFREGNARQNAHCIFVCLALKLLEKRIHVACKEIITLDKQSVKQKKLLEEEDKEKREEEERKERKRSKEREKELRRKERLRGKDKDKKCSESSQTPLHPDASQEVLSSCLDEETNNSKRGFANENGDTPGVLDEWWSNDYMASGFSKNGFDSPGGELGNVEEGDCFPSRKNNLKGSLQRSGVQGGLQLETSLKWSDTCESTENGALGYKSWPRHYGESLKNHSKGINCLDRQSRANDSHFHNGSNCLRLNQKVHYSNIRMADRNNHHLCGSNHLNDYREMVESHSPLDVTPRVDRRCESVFHSEARSLYHHKEMNNEQVDVTPICCKLNETADLCAGCSSSSDNCSLCFSEEESNAPSSSHSNVESSSTSDSEDSSQQSEVRDSPMCVQNGLSKTHDIEKVKIENIKVEQGACLPQSSSFSSQNVRSHIHWDFPTEISPQNGEEANIAPGLVPVQQSVLSPFYNPNISFPVLQGPTTMGYYHQTPIAWSGTPPNGFVTSPHPSHYCSSGPFSYGPNGGDSPLCMLCGPVELLASYTMSQIPLYQQAPGCNCFDPLEQTNARKVSRVIGPSGEPRTQKVNPTGCDQTVVHPIGGIEKGYSTKLDSRNTGFSLFQFGGPVALPPYRSNLPTSDQGKSGDISCCHIKGSRTCSKKEITEEYSLFAPSNGIQFSIF